MLTRALDAGVPAGWVCADEIYGQDKRLRVWCEQHDLPYVLATRSTDTVATVEWRQRRGGAPGAPPPPAGRRRGLGRGGGRPPRPPTPGPPGGGPRGGGRALTPGLPGRAGRGCRAGAGAPAPRLYDWALLELLAGFAPGGPRGVLARRTIPTGSDEPAELA